MLKRGGYGKDFSHRVGNVPVLPPRKPNVKRIWIQAVSVGETEAIAPFLRELKKRQDIEVVLTTTTSTAYKIIREKYADLLLAHACFPIDFFPFSQLAWKRFNPSFVILMEGELWPEHLYQAKKRNVPVFLINARLSDKSFRRYQKISSVARWLLGHVDLICAGTQNDCSRFLKLGVPEEKLILTGNMKFDVAQGEELSEAEKLDLFRALFNTKDASPVLLGSSTWQGEEEVLLEAFAKARSRDKTLKLLLVPRHAERRAEIVELFKNTSWKWYLKSKTAPQDVPENADICIADTTGELRRLTQIAHLAFVGKSLLPNKGGQTPIECAALGVPVVYGTEMSNFKDACRSLEDIGAAVKVQDKNSAVLALNELLEDSKKREAMGAFAKSWHAGNRGATQRTLKEIYEKI